MVTNPRNLHWFRTCRPLLDKSYPELTLFILLYYGVARTMVCAHRTRWSRPVDSICLPVEETACISVVKGTMKYYSSILEAIGHTPLLRLNKLGQEVSPLMLAKVEYFNPGGSVKDRIGISMLEASEQAGLLKPGSTIVEPTSGNTGTGLALAALVKGYHCVFVMTDKVSEEKRSLLRALGAEVVICPNSAGHDSPDNYHNVAARLAREIPGAFSPDQYSNPANPLAHYRTTGPEIWNDTDGKVTAFVAGVGTAGTIIGTARYLKEQNPRIQIIGADPAGSIYSGDSPRPYKVEGIGTDNFPENYAPEL